MSLVAYDASSDEESDVEDTQNQYSAQKPMQPEKQTDHKTSGNSSIGNGHISDDEDEFMTNQTEEPSKSSTFSLALPKPIRESTVHDLLQDIPKPPFQALPSPKPIGAGIITEEDDEFLHKKDKFLPVETKPLPNAAKISVKISIPSLKDFRDVQNDQERKGKSVNTSVDKPKTSAGLLGLLPQAKSERCFKKQEKDLEQNKEKVEKSLATMTIAPAFVPDSVKYKRPAHNTEEFGGTKTTKYCKRQEDSRKLVACSDSDVSDEEEVLGDCRRQDFFSLTSDDRLPEVSSNEINAMVAKKAAKIAEVTSKYLSEAESAHVKESENTHSNIQELEMARKRYHDQQLDSLAVQALEGSSAKRRRNQKETINIMDINSAEILPSRDEWMRTALASSTVYQPTGVLNDEEPAAGTRKKHQITYLAHKAKANEAELQAMWAANRQTRRATQSKYGF